MNTEVDERGSRSGMYSGNDPPLWRHRSYMLWVRKASSRYTKIGVPSSLRYDDRVLQADYGVFSFERLERAGYLPGDDMRRSPTAEK